MVAIVEDSLEILVVVNVGGSLEVEMIALYCVDVVLGVFDVVSLEVILVAIAEGSLKSLVVDTVVD